MWNSPITRTLWQPCERPITIQIYSGADRRPPDCGVFLENNLVVQGKQRRLVRAQQRQRQGELEHARGEQPKKNGSERGEKEKEVRTGTGG